MDNRKFKISNAAKEAEEKRVKTVNEATFWRHNAFTDLWDEDGSEKQKKKRRSSAQPMASPVPKVLIETYSSYKPSEEDHQSMLFTALREEFNLQTKKMKIERALGTGNVELEEIDEEEIDRQILNSQPPPLKEPKGHQNHIKEKSDLQRRRLSRYKKQLLLQREAKQRKEKLKQLRRDIDNLDHIKQEIEHKAQASAERKAKPKSVSFPRIGKYFHNQSPSSLLLSDELPSKIRSIKVNFSLSFSLSSLPFRAIISLIVPILNIIYYS